MKIKFGASMELVRPNFSTKSDWTLLSRSYLFSTRCNQQVPVWWQQWIIDSSSLADIVSAAPSSHRSQLSPHTWKQPSGLWHHLALESVLSLAGHLLWWTKWWGAVFGVNIQNNKKYEQINSNVTLYIVLRCRIGITAFYRYKIDTLPY